MPVRTGRPRRLSGVFQHRDTERLDFADRGDVAEKVDRDDRLRGGSQGRVHGLRRDHHRLRIDVAEDGTGAGRWDRLGGRVERERWDDDIVAGPDAHRAQGDRQRVRAVRDADDVIDAEIVGELALEGRDLGAEDEAALVDGVGRGTDEAVAEARTRSVDVEQGIGMVAAPGERQAGRSPPSASLSRPMVLSGQPGTLRGAVIGLGMIGRHHARLLQGSDRVEFAGAVDPGGDRYRSVHESRARVRDGGGAPLPGSA